MSKPGKWTAVLAMSMIFGQAGVLPALADCAAAANRVVAQTGGQLLSAEPGKSGGQAVCTVTVLVPGSGSERPRKVSMTVPE